MANTKKRRSKGDGCIYKKGKVYLARWVITLDGKKKVFTRSTETGEKDKALAILKGFVAPYKLGTKEKILQNQVAELKGVQAQIQRIEDEMPALKIDSAWPAYVNAPNRPDSGKRTMDGYESQFQHFTKWMLKNHPAVTELRAVTEEIAFEFAGELGRTNTPNTYNKYLVLLRRVWKVLFKTARLSCNPWSALENKLLATHSRRELTVDELIKVLASVQGEMRILFAIGLYCGLRLGDAVLLKWSNVDLIRGQLILVPSKTARRANGKVLRVPLHRSLAAMLAETPEEERHDYVMPGLVETYQYRNTKGTYLVKRIREVFESCGIETQCEVEGYSRRGVDVGYHSLRHSFVSLSANAGTSLAAVQAVVGHSNPAMTRHYLHADPTVIRNAVAALPDITGNKEQDQMDVRVTAVLKELETLSEEQLKKVSEKIKQITALRKSQNLKQKNGTDEIPPPAPPAQASLPQAPTP